MHDISRKFMKVPVWPIILISLLLLTALIIYFYFQIGDEKLAAIIGGVGAGIVAYLIDFLLSIYQYKQIDRFRALGIQEILTDRKREEYYKKIVRGAKNTVQVIGSSCSRFVNDFANPDNSDHVLIDALDRNPNLSVQLLIPTEEKMDQNSKHKFEAQKDKITKLKNKYGTRVQLKRYDFEPRHSFVRVDNDIVIGPIFQEIESQNSPAIHFDIRSIYAEKYIDYFSWVWNQS